MNNNRTITDHTRQTVGVRLFQRCIELFALGVLLALADMVLHGQLETLFDNPTATLRSLIWMVIIYCGLSLIIALLLRNRRRVTALVVFGFILAQGGLWYYRNELGEPLSSFHSLLPIAGTFLAAFVIAWIVSKVPEKLPTMSRSAIAPVVGIVLVALISLTVMVPPPESPGPWPQTPHTTSKNTGKPNVLLITLDTVRPDHLGAYDYDVILTPNLDKVAAEGVLYLRGVSQAPITPVSHASILTGVYPPKHNLRNFEYDNRLSRENLLLSEILSEAGYLAGAIIASPTLHPLFGLDRGFDLYHYVASSENYLFAGFGRSLLPTVMQVSGLVKDRTAYRSGVEQTDDALLWLDKYRDVPFFLWLHYFDAHDPYFPDQESKRSERHPGRESNDLSGRTFDYDCEIVGLDLQIGRIIDRLRKHDILDETIIAVISDHGEGLGEHNYIGHTKRIYDEQLRLVLFLRYPGRIRGGQVASTQVRSIDLAPTILELLDIQVPPGMDGLSLLPLAEPGGNSQHRLAYSETFAPDDRDQHLVSANDGRYKLIRSLGGENWLYDVGEDPGECINLSDERPVEMTRLGTLLDDYLSNGALAKDEEENPIELDEEIREKLQALGYIDR